MCMYDILRELENFCVELERIVISKSQLINKRKNETSSLLIILTKYSYKFTDELKTSCSHRSMSPLKKRGNSKQLYEDKSSSKKNYNINRCDLNNFENFLFLKKFLKKVIIFMLKIRFIGGSNI